MRLGLGLGLSKVSGEYQEVMDKIKTEDNQTLITEDGEHITIE